MPVLYSAPGLDVVYGKEPSPDRTRTQSDPAHGENYPVCTPSETSGVPQHQHQWNQTASCLLRLSWGQVSLEIFSPILALWQVIMNEFWRFSSKGVSKKYTEAHSHKKAPKPTQSTDCEVSLIFEKFWLKLVGAFKALWSSKSWCQGKWKIICGGRQVPKHLYSAWQLNHVSHVSWFFKASFCLNRLFHMQPCFRKGTEISAMLNSLTDALYGETVRLRSSHKHHRSSQAWASLQWRQLVITLSVGPLLKEEGVGLWDKRLMTWRIPEAQGQMEELQYPGQGHAPLPIFKLNSVLNYFPE